MKRNSQLSVVLHVLIHMIAFEKPVTSELMAAALVMNAVVIRRAMAGLRDAGFVRSEKGHGGGWIIACDPKLTTLLDIYRAIGAPDLFAMTNRTEAPGCLVEQAVNKALKEAFRDAGQLLLQRFAETTLTSLTDAFKLSFKARRCL
ncbi:MAG: Rrf2 family transcriptional regulator [Acidobacteriota bacterium]|nr:Rrf2 family transcriptional regulator [Acidobacteriota bacterium]